VVAMARSMMKRKGMPGRFWGEAVSTTVYLLNRAPTKSVVGMTPYEAWYGRKPSVDYLRTFGCVAHVKPVTGHTSKLADRSTPMVMIGYEAGTKAYRAYNPVNKKLVVTRNVLFEEEKSWNWSSTEPVEPISNEIFTVVYNDNLHADNQHIVPRDDADQDGMNSGPVAYLSLRTEDGASPGVSRGFVSRATRAEVSASSEGNRSGARAREASSRSSAPGGSPASSDAACSPGSQASGPSWPEEPTRGSPASSPARAGRHVQDGGRTNSPRGTPPGSRPGGQTDAGTELSSGGDLVAVMGRGRERGADREPVTDGGLTSPASGGSAKAETSAESSASPPTVHEERRWPPTLERLQNVLDLYPLEMLRTINPIRTTRARGRGRGGCLMVRGRHPFGNPKRKV
jgi:hypothetical protein